MAIRLSSINPKNGYDLPSSGAAIEGSMAALNASDKLVPATDASGLKVVGILTAIEGSVGIVECDRLLVKNDSTNGFDKYDRGATAYVKDKDTVCTATGSTNKVVAGLVVDVTDDGVFIDFSPAAIAAAKIQAAAITDLTTASATATQCATAINGILAALRKNGIVASA